MTTELNPPDPKPEPPKFLAPYTCPKCGGTAYREIGCRDGSHCVGYMCRCSTCQTEYIHWSETDYVPYGVEIGGITYEYPKDEPQDTPDLRAALQRLLKAADALLVDARDRGECFVDEDHEDYDPDNPEQMWGDFAALDEAADAARQILDGAAATPTPEPKPAPCLTTAKTHTKFREALMRAWVDGWNAGLDDRISGSDDGKRSCADRLAAEFPAQEHADELLDLLRTIERDMRETAECREPLTTESVVSVYRRVRDFLGKTKGVKP